MAHLFRLAVLATLATVASMPLVADDLGDSTSLLCSVSQATRCDADNCIAIAPQRFNIPQFIVVDLEKKTLGTTEASGENRSTPIENLERDGDSIYLQGIEQGRAFSLVVNIGSGSLSAAMARHEATVTLFGACTPVDAAQ